MSEWLIEDSETLSATLSLVASWDSGDDKRGHGSSPSSSSSDGARESQAQCDTSGVAGATDTKTSSETKTSFTARPGRVNATRERRKREIEALRDVAAQLQRQLGELKDRREAMLRPHFNGTMIKSTAPVWETLARRQFQSRKRSETYNAKLRAQIADQVTVAQGLMNAIQYITQRQALHERVRSPLAVDVGRHVSEVDQVTRLHCNVDRWQWALSLSPKFHCGELQFTDFVVVESDCQHATLDFYDSYMLPYSVGAVSSVVWSAFHEESSGFDEDAGEDVAKYQQAHKTADDTLVAVFTEDSSMGGASASRGTIRGQWAAKQHRLRGRDDRLIAMQWHFELSGFGNELDGVSVNEDDWVRFVDSKDIGCPQVNGPLTVLQHVRRLRISFNRSDGVDERHASVVTDLLSREIEGELAFAQRTLENTLMTPVLGPRPQ